MNILGIFKADDGWYCVMSGYRVYGFPTYLAALRYAQRGIHDYTRRNCPIYS